MPRTHSVEKLPKEKLKEVKDWIRSAGYSRQIEIRDKLEKEGFSISKSAINRYAIKLKALDSARGVDTNIVAGDKWKLVALFDELHDLKLKEADLLAQIRALSVS